MTRTNTYYDLVNACGAEGCPVCRLALDAVHRYLDAVEYESVNDPAMRDQLRRAQGFCSRHAHQWLRQAHVLGTATIYADMLRQVDRDLRRLSLPRTGFIAGIFGDRIGGDPASARGDSRLEPNGTCPACENLAETEMMAITTLLDAIGEPDFRDAFTASAGLCLPHLREALHVSRDEASFVALRDIAARNLEELLGQLREIIRKHDYRYAGEAAGAERGAAERAVRFTIGAAGVFVERCHGRVEADSSLYGHVT